MGTDPLHITMRGVKLGQLCEICCEESFTGPDLLGISYPLTNNPAIHRVLPAGKSPKSINPKLK